MWDLIRTYLPIVLLVAAVITVGICFEAAKEPTVDDSLVHWHATIPGLVLAPDRFYGKLKNVVNQLAIPGAIVSEITLYEVGWAGYSRPYVRVRQRNLVYYLFAARLGESFFVSSWLLHRRSVIGKALPYVPLVGWIFSRMMQLLHKETLFVYDSAFHFHEIVHNSVLSVVDSLTSIANVAPLAAEERKPVMRELYRQPVAPRLAL